MEIAARFAACAALLLAAGVPLYLTLARESGGARLAALAALAAIPASLWWVLEAIAAMAALPLVALDGATVHAVLEATPLGTVMALRLLALLAALVALWRRRMAPAALMAALALATMAWTGHAGAGEGGAGMLLRASDIVHLLAAATWCGALALFLGAALAGQDRVVLVRRLSGFAATGSAIVLLLLLTGIANSLLIAGWPPDLASLWARVLGIKLALFAAMLALAAVNRWRLTPLLERDPQGGLGALRLSLALESGAALAVLGLVSWLGTLSPV